MKKTLAAAALAITAITALPASPAATVTPEALAQLVVALEGTAFIPSVTDPMCGVEATIIVSGADLVSHTPPGGPEPSNLAFVFVSARDTCQNIPLLFGVASFEDVDFVVSANKKSATLSMAGDAMTVPPGMVPFKVELTWTATGGIAFHDHSTSHEMFDSMVINTRSDAKIYPAAVDGFVAMDDLRFDISDGEGALMRDADGRIEVKHP